MNPFTQKNDETRDDIEFLLPYSVLAADALHGIGAAVVSAVFLH
jgi:hypothetical protein